MRFECKRIKYYNMKAHGEQFRIELITHSVLLACLFLTVSGWLAAQGLPLENEGGNGDKDAGKALLPYIEAIRIFSENVPQEKVYLHFDNTSYFKGDNIWFKAYIAISGNLQASPLSKTLYVELLNPGGEVVDKRILKIADGQCHGEFALDHLPFYSGFYEVRAYTKYMLNFGEDVIFSRLLPVFNRPKTEGDYAEKKMLGYTRSGPAGNYPMKRSRPEKGNTVNVRFFPEGGNLIQGVESRVAFEATDEAGNPIDVTGIVTDGSKQEVCRFATSHEGRGVFSYMPTDDKGKTVAEVEYERKKYRFELPNSILTGVVMEVDNLTHPDSIIIALRRNEQTPPEMLGIAIICGYNPLKAYFAFTEVQVTYFQIDKNDLSTGVSQIVLFNGKGEILCDRLVFAGINNRLEIKANAEKSTYLPYESVEMDFSVTDPQSNPVKTSFSLSVRDGANEVGGHHDILTDLLLMSDIKGYIKNPSYYFEQKQDFVETLQATSHLDVLLMVQGWRRYSWKQMTGVEPLEIKYMPEQGIEVHGTVVTLVREKPKENVDVSLLLNQKEEETEKSESAYTSFISDEKGRFSFVTDVQGTWSMILSVMEKNKKKDHKILLDRVYMPDPVMYRFSDLQVSITEANGIQPVEETSDQEQVEDFEEEMPENQDSISKLGIDQKTHRLPEVTVKAKRRTREQEIFRSRSTSIAYYDVSSEVDDIYDRGDFLGDDLFMFLKKMDNNFTLERPFYGGSDSIGGYEEFISYNLRPVLFIVNYEKTGVEFNDELKHRILRLPAIKSIYINKNTSVMANYIVPPIGSLLSPYEIASKMGCAVFIETYPAGKIPVSGAKGVRKTRLDGYSVVKEFYNPNYAELPPELDSDYRRTLYWNPSVTTDATGVVKIQFFNNGSCKDFSISAETVTPQGKIGVYQK